MKDCERAIFILAYCDANWLRIFSWQIFCFGARFATFVDRPALLVGNELYSKSYATNYIKIKASILISLI
jgi:hypothetical protein